MTTLQIIVNTLERITGGKPLDYYAAGLIFSLIAITFSVYLHSRKRDVKSKNTPTKFSLYFMLWDNIKRAVVGLLFMFILFRLFDLSNVAMMIGVGFFVALGLDKGLEWLMEYTDIANFLKRDRTKIVDKIENKPE